MSDLASTLLGATTSVFVTPGNPVRYQVLLPGETPVPGSSTGRTGAAIDQTAGQSFGATVRLVDAHFNRVTSHSPLSIRLTAPADPYDTELFQPINPLGLVQGQAVFTGVGLVTASSGAYVRGQDTGLTFAAGDSSTMTVRPNTAAGVVIALPGETQVNGKNTAPVGRTGTVLGQTAGLPFNATVYAVDSFFNLVSTITGKAITVTSDDPNVPNLGVFNMVGGVANANAVSLGTARTTTLTATDTSGAPPLLGNRNSSPVTVVPGLATRLQILVPGETPVPGSPGGKVGTPLTQNAGQPFDVSVRITDGFYNLAEGSTATVRIQTSVSTTTSIGPLSFTSSGVFSGGLAVSLTRAVTTQLTVFDTRVPAQFASQTSPDIFVEAGQPARLVGILPGQQFDPGGVFNEGRLGTPLNQRAGIPFNASVAIVDNFFNIRTGVPVSVRVTLPTDPYAVQPATVAVDTASGYATVPVIMRLAASSHHIHSEEIVQQYGADQQSSSFTVTGGDAVGLQVLIPPQTRVGGSGDYPNGGIAGSAGAQQAGVPFTVTVNLVDQFMNLSTGPTPVVTLTSNDSFAPPASPPSAGIGGPTGQALFTVTLVTRSTGAVVYAATGDSVCGPAQNAPCSSAAPAAQSAPFNLNAGPATRLQVLLPGETAVPGSPTGKTGTPTTFTINPPNTVNVTVRLTDAFYNQNPSAVMPKVSVFSTTDPDADLPPAATLSGGLGVFAIAPHLAISTWTVAASTTTDSPVSYSSGTSSGQRVNPGPGHHLHLSGLPASVTAGVPFTGVVTAHDRYHNVASTGANVYTGTVRFEGEVFVDPVQNPSFLSPTVTFAPADAGVKTLTNHFTLRKAGLRTLRVIDTGNPTINTGLAGFSTDPTVTVNPGSPVSVFVTPSDDQLSPAGSVPEPGRQTVVGQITDGFNNPVVAAGVPLTVQVVDVLGSTGTIRVDYGAGFVNAGTSTGVVTDANGQIGVNPQIAYFVSSKANDWARVWVATFTAPADVSPFISARTRVSGRLITTGGTPSKLVFISTPTQALVGLSDVPGSGGEYTVQRLDDFNNVTDQGQTDIVLQIAPSEVALHQAAGFSLGFLGVTGDFGFMNGDPHSGGQFIPVTSIPPGFSQTTFRYHDRMSSYSGVQPSSNTAEGGRPGTWTVTALSGAMVPAVHALRMDPFATSRVAFGNPARSLVAGKLTSNTGLLQSFRAQLQDLFANPTVATAPVTVALSTVTRQNSGNANYFGFSTSSGVLLGVPPTLQSTATLITVPLNAYQATFYYLDTTASSAYAVTFPTKPVIGVAVPAQPTWNTATQAVFISPDLTQRVAVTQVPAGSLLAGATSQAFQFQIQDQYANPAPVLSGQEDSPTQGIAFKLNSDSGGQVTFSSPGNASFSGPTGSAKLALGQHSTTFYLIDTQVSKPTHTLTVDSVSPRGWQVGRATYTVTPAPPDHLAFLTPVRRLVAGTTVQYVTGVPTNTIITVEFRDRFENVSPATQTIFVDFNSTMSATMSGGIDPSQPVNDQSLGWSRIGVAQIPLRVFATPGVSSASLYVWDKVIGTTSIQAIATVGSTILQPAYQDLVVTPSTASYLTVHHNFHASTPLKVAAPGLIQVVARDVFGNVASGDPQNGQYYTGTIKWGHSGNPGDVTLVDLINGSTTHTFTVAEAGVFATLQVSDLVQETLAVSATDLFSPGIFGRTNDITRPIPTHSDGDIVVGGLVMVPNDLAPQEPIPSNKQAVGVTRTRLFQGDGLLPLVPYPIPMMRLQLFAAPSDVPTLSGQLQTLLVKNTGNLPPAHVQEIGLYHDEDSNGIFEGETVQGGAQVDKLIALGSYSTVQQAWVFSNLNTVDPVRSVVTAQSRNYFIAVRISTGALSPSTFGLEIPNPSFVILTATSAVGVARNNFPIATTEAEISRQPAQVRFTGEDIAAWWQPTTSSGTLPLGKYNFVNQGVPRAGMLALKVWTDAFTGVVGRVRVTHSGSGADSDIASVRLYLDSVGGDGLQGDGIFQPAIDKEVTSPSSPPVFSTSTPRTILLPLTTPGTDGIVDPSTRTFFVVYEMSPSATPNQTHGAVVASGNILLFDGNATPFQVISSSLATVNATPDQAILTDVNRVAPNNFSVAPFLTQGDFDQPVARLTMQTLSGSAIWSGLKLDHWIPTASNGGSPLHGKASDVSGIGLWEDTNDNGLFDPGVDQSVLDNPSVTRLFPSGPLAVALSSSATTIQVNGVLSFFPGDDPFPQAPGRLVLNDGDTDPETREVVTYTGVDVPNNAFTGVQRGREGTVARSYPVGTVISGQARLPLNGAAGGQALSGIAQDYFVTLSLDTLAKVHPQANLGVVMMSTSYFLIDAPKTMSAFNVGLPPAGRSASFIPTTNEYPDQVLVKATDTVETSSSFLQQDATSQVILSFTMEADRSEALWRFALVTATGSATAAGDLTNDVVAVKIWHDANNSGFFDGSDVMIGTGTFGNTGPQAVAKVDLGANAQRIVTAARATAEGRSQRYFVSYDMGPAAQPTDGQGNARTLGAVLSQASFVQSDFAVDNPLTNALSLPNFFNTASPLPFRSVLRPIVPSPRTMTVTAEPLFLGVSGAALPAPRLDQNINTTGATDAAWIVTNTSGMADSGYALVDSEIISYDMKATGALIQVKRGQLGTVATTHSSGTVIGPMLSQGALNAPAMKLTAVASGFNIRWQGAAFTRMVAGLTGADADSSEIRVWKDNGNGIFDRDPGSGLNIIDTPLGIGKFGAPNPVGTGVVPLNDPTLGNPGYTLVSTTPATYFVTMSVSPSARFSHESLTPPNEVLGVQVLNPGDMQLGPTGAGHTAAFTNAIRGPVHPLVPTINTMIATPFDVAPLTVSQNSKSVGMLSLSMRTDKNTSLWQAVRLRRTGTGADSDIEAIKVWRDVNQNGLFDAQDTTQTAPGVFPNLVSFGNETFSSATVNVTFRSPVVVTTTPVQYFVSYDVSQFSTVGGSQGLLIPDTNYMTVNIPNLISFSTAPIRTKEMVVEKAPSRVTMGFYDAASDLGATSGVAQAQQNVTVLRFSLQTDISLATWRTFRIQRNGTSSDSANAFGKNTDVKFVRLYKDIDQNDQLSPLDLNVSEVETQASASIPSTLNPPFDLPVVSTVGFPAEGRILVNNAELMVFSSTGVSAGQAFLRVEARGQVIGNFTTPRLTHAAGTRVRKVDMFDQANNLNTQILMNLSVPQPISPTPQVFFLVYDIGDSAVINNSVGVQILDRFWVGVPTPDEMTPNVRFNISRTNAQQGTAVVSYPIQSSNINIRPIFLTAKWNSVAPLASTPTAVNVPFLQLAFNTNANKSDLGSLVLTQSGTGNTATAAGRGIGDLTRLKVWLDNGNGLFNPVEETPLGETTSFSVTGFAGNRIIKSTVPLAHADNPFLTVTTVPVNLFISGDIGSVDQSSQTTVGHLVGVSLAAFDDIRDINGNTLAIAPDPNNPTPIPSRLVQIAQAVVTPVAVLPKVMLAPNGYPAYALLDTNGNPVRDAQARPIADSTRWVTVGGEPLLDLDGDGSADNFDCVDRGMRSCISLVGNGTPSVDLDGDGIYDVDLNGDGIPDQVTQTGTYLVNSVGQTVYVSQNFAPVAWTSDATTIRAAMPVLPGVVGYYQIGAASDYNHDGAAGNPDPDLSNGWITAGPTVGAANALGIRPSALAASQGTIGNLALLTPRITRLTSALGLTDSSMNVESTSGFFEQGVIYVGSEMIAVRKANATRFDITERGPNVGGSVPQLHLPGEVLSDQAAVFMVRVVSSPTATTPIVPPRPLFLYRLDVKSPSAPGAPILVPPAGSSFQIEWVPAASGISDLNRYEIQERTGNDPVWRTIAVVPATRGRFVNNLYQQNANGSYRVGTATNDNPGERPRAPGFYTYRVRAFNNAGIASPWSVDSAAIGTGQVASVISQVSNFPNPVDTRKAGPAGRTAITYVLNADAEVKITLYDLLGYVVREFTFQPGQQGGKAGPNFVTWDGTNSLNNKVAKGGYIARIEVKSPSGTAVALRKIGIIH